MAQIFPYEAKLPFTDTTLWVRELTTSEQKSVLKSILATGPKHKDEFFRFFKQLICTCVSNSDDLQRINIIEFILVSLKVAIHSFGSTKKVQYQNPDPLNPNKLVSFNYDVSFQQLINRVFALTSKSFIAPLECQNMTVFLQWPNISDYNHLCLGDDELSINEFVIPFISKIRIHGNELVFDPAQSFHQRKKIFSHIPARAVLEIQERVLDVLNTLTRTGDLFDLPNVPYTLTIVNYSVVDLIKLIYETNITSIYTEILLLTQNHFSAEYVESISEVERKVLIKLIEATKKASQTTEGTDIPVESPQE